MAERHFMNPADYKATTRALNAVFRDTNGELELKQGGTSIGRSGCASERIRNAIMAGVNAGEALNTITALGSKQNFEPLRREVPRGDDVSDIDRALWLIGRL